MFLDSTPELSIIVPVFNKVLFVEDCIKSILAQEFTDFEIILVDDGSTDGSAEKLVGMLEMDQRIRLVRQQNRGVSAARNTGLKLAVGTYIGFVDSDDFVEPDMYKILLTNARIHQADISVCGIKKIYPKREALYYGTGKISAFNKEEAIDLLLEGKLQGSVYDKIYRNQVAKKIQFEGSINEDIFYNFLAFQESSICVFDDVIKYHYIVRDNSASMAKYDRRYLDMVNFAEKMVQISKSQSPKCIAAAENFEIVANISILNLLLLSQVDKHSAAFGQVFGNLSRYAAYIYKSGKLRLKHRVALSMILNWLYGYRFFLKMYLKLFNSDAIYRV